MPGSPANRCVRVGAHRDVRSGGFLAGNFGFDEQLFATTYEQTQRHSAVKIYWIPLHVDHMPELAVQATLLPGRTVTRTYTQNQVATAGGDVFYPSAVPNPGAGHLATRRQSGPQPGLLHRDLPRGFHAGMSAQPHQDLPHREHATLPTHAQTTWPLTPVGLAPH
jgi:hypothetical protein